MTNIYLSTPSTTDLMEEVRLVRRLLIKMLTDNKLTYDINSEHNVLCDWPHIDPMKSTNHFKDDMKQMTYRLQLMGQCEHFIFIDHWLDLKICRTELDVLKNYNLDWKKAILRLHDNELVIV